MPDHDLNILDSRPQEDLFDVLDQAFAADARVEQVIQRGSFAKQQSDRASDIDLLLVVRDADIGPFLDGLTARLAESCSVLTPQGWIDTIVPDFGGIGFVYLVKHQERLIQLDVYVTPASWSERIHTFKEKRILTSRPGFVADYSELPKPKQIIMAYIGRADREFQIIFEFLLIVLMLSKHMYRLHPTLAAKYRYAAIETLAVFLRLVFTPDRIGYKMYDWEHDFKDVSVPAVRAFEHAITRIDVYSFDELLNLLDIFKTVLYEACGNDRYREFKALIREVETYCSCLLSPVYE